MSWVYWVQSLFIVSRNVGKSKKRHNWHISTNKIFISCSYWFTTHQLLFCEVGWGPIKVCIKAYFGPGVVTLGIHPILLGFHQFDRFVYSWWLQVHTGDKGRFLCPSSTGNRSQHVLIQRWRIVKQLYKQNLFKQISCSTLHTSHIKEKGFSTWLHFLIASLKPPECYVLEWTVLQHSASWINASFRASSYRSWLARRD